MLNKISALYCMYVIQLIRGVLRLSLQVYKDLTKLLMFKYQGTEQECEGPVEFYGLL